MFTIQEQVANQEVPEHICAPCAEFEKRQSGGSSLHSKDYVVTIKAAPDDTAVWQAGIEARLIRIIRCLALPTVAKRSAVQDMVT